MCCLVVSVASCTRNTSRQEQFEAAGIISDSFRMPTVNSANIPEIPLYDESGNDIILLSPIRGSAGASSAQGAIMELDSALSLNAADSALGKGYFFQVDNYSEYSSWLLTITDSVVEPQLFYQDQSRKFSFQEIAKIKNGGNGGRYMYPAFQLTLLPGTKVVFLLWLNGAKSKFSAHITFKPRNTKPVNENPLFYLGIVFVVVLFIFGSTIYFFVYTRDFGFIVFLFYLAASLIFFSLPYFGYAYYYKAYPLFFKILALFTGASWCGLLVLLSGQTSKLTRHAILVFFMGIAGIFYPIWEEIFHVSAYLFSILAYGLFLLLFLSYLFTQKGNNSVGKIDKLILLIISFIPLANLLLTRYSFAESGIAYSIQSQIVHVTPILFYVTILRRFIKVRATRRENELASALSIQNELSNAIIQNLEMERKRFAEDLHDELGSNLAALKIQMSKGTMDAWKLNEMSGLIDKMAEAARRIAHNLMPPRFAETPLRLILMEFFDSLNISGTIYFQFYFTGSDDRFSKDEELVIYRIVMELAHNCIRHSKADNCIVQFIEHTEYLEINFEDNGVGFQRQLTESTLHTVRSRVLYLKGTLNVDSNQQGSIIIIRIPITGRSLV